MTGRERLSEMDMRLMVKGPSEAFDQIIECSSQWTVNDLKLHLNQVYVTHPPPETQRIIFSGHLLIDSQRLTDIFNLNDLGKIFTVHLVCNQPAAFNSPTKPPEVAQPASAVQNLHVNVTSSPPNSTTDENRINALDLLATLNNFEALLRDQENANISLTVDSASSSIGVPADVDEMMRQIATLQQLCMTIMGQSPATLSGIGDASTAAGNVSAAPVVQQPPAVVAQPPAAPPAAAPVANDGVRERDWLDWIYMISGSMLLLSYIFMYTSLTRVLFVITLALIVYFLNLMKVYAHFNSRIQRPQRPQQLDENGNNPLLASDGSISRRNSSQQRQTTNTDFSTSLKLAFTYVSAFFVSIIPTPVPNN